MAYRDFSKTDFEVPDFRLRLAQRQRLGKVERDVVMLARHDRPSSIRPSTVLERLARRIFGFSSSNALADARLEALRRFAVIAIRTGSAGPDEVATLIDNGFSELEIEQARQLAQRYHRPSRLSLSALTSLLMTTIIGVGAFLWVKTRIGDSVVSAIIVAYLGLPIVTSVAPRRYPARDQRTPILR